MSMNDSVVSLVSAHLEQLVFGWIDYTLFGTMLGVSILIGIYFGFFSKKQDNTTEYLLGGKSMGYFPVSMSLIASNVSGITLLGVPSEVYQYGTQYAACVFTCTITSVITAYIYLPVFYKLQLTSTFEYLEVRFAKHVRVLGSVLFTLSLITYIPIVVYGPALAFSQATGFSIHIVTTVISIVCIFYTTIGGLKAVVWTDTIQLTITLGSLFAVLFLGISAVGGVQEIWKISNEGGRIIFWDMNPSPFRRTSFWGMAFGMVAAWLSYLAVGQSCIQKFLAVPTLYDARKALLLTTIGFIVMKLISVFTGLIIYAKYHDCDPFTTKVVSKSDQILPYYVIDVAGKIPGLPGLFLAGLVSAGLSTMSACLNTSAGTIYKDFIEAWIPDSENKEARAAAIMKITVVVVGACCVGMAFMMDHLSDIFQVSVSLNGITAGALLGLFTLGMLVPWASAIGAMIGGCFSLAFMTWIVVGAQWNIVNNKIHHETLSTSTENCPYPLNLTNWTKATLAPIEPEEKALLIYSLSFLYYSLLGTLAVVVVGTVASFATGAMDTREINWDHISPVLHRFLPVTKYSEVPVPLTPIDPEHDKPSDG